MLILSDRQAFDKPRTQGSCSMQTLERQILTLKYGEGRREAAHQKLLDRTTMSGPWPPVKLASARSPTSRPSAGGRAPLRQGGSGCMAALTKRTQVRNSKTKLHV